MAVIKNLNYQIDQFTLHIDQLEIAENAVTVIMGPSGSGKTTLFHLLMGYVEARNWVFEINGINLADLSISERKLGVVFQNDELFPHLTAAENVQIIMQSRNNLNAKTLNQLETFKTVLNLDTCWNTKAQYLSGGERQRVSLLRALMSNPRMLLLDEPFSALDPENKNEARQLLKKVLAIAPLTTLMISHDQADADAFNQKVVHLKNGRIQ